MSVNSSIQTMGGLIQVIVKVLLATWRNAARAIAAEAVAAPFKMMMITSVIVRQLITTTMAIFLTECAKLPKK